MLRTDLCHFSRVSQLSDTEARRGGKGVGGEDDKYVANSHLRRELFS